MTVDPDEIHNACYVSVFSLLGEKL